MLLEHVESSFDYLVIAPGLILSEHSSIADARRARIAAIGEGFSDVIILKRTPKGWELQSSGKSKPEQQVPITKLTKPNGPA